MSQRQSSPPAIVVVLALESEPRVLVVAETAEDEARILADVGSSPRRVRQALADLADLVAGRAA